MATSLERIRTKITELEAQVVDLRTAERELQALDRQPAQKTRAAPTPKTKREPKAKRVAKAARAPKAASAPRTRSAAKGGQTIGAAILEALDQRGSVAAAEIAEHIKATGRDITNRTVSFALQALKKRGLAKNTDGKWSVAKARK
jgi:DNA-binding transcriptional ArsR family regulator